MVYEIGSNYQLDKLNSKNISLFKSIIFHLTYILNVLRKENEKYTLPEIAQILKAVQKWQKTSNIDSQNSPHSPPKL